jgi:hypothetical protein
MTDPPRDPGRGQEPDAATLQPATTPPGQVNSTALRLSRTPWDMAKAVLILLVPIMIAVGVYVFFFGGSSPIVIDPSGSYGDARSAGAFPVVQPQALPSGWKSVSSAYGVENGRHVLRVGYIAPDGAGLQLVESDGAAATVISDEVGTANPVGASVDIGGRTWGKVATSKHNQHALIDTGNGYTIIVKGQASDTDLRTFAAALH